MPKDHLAGASEGSGCVSAAPLIRYRTIYSGKIEKREVTRETDKTVWLMETDFRGRPVERKRARSSEYEQWHDTWEAAHAYLVNRAEEKVVAARRALQRAQDVYGNVKGMRKPRDGSTLENAGAPREAARPDDPDLRGGAAE